MNVSTSLVGQAKVVLDSGNADIIEAVETGKKSVSAAANEIRTATKDKAQRKKPAKAKPPQSKSTQSDAAKSMNVSTSLVGQAKVVLDSGVIYRSPLKIVRTV
jgi:hypothetical protein